MPHGPTPVVEISFDDGPYVASPTWVDVTSYVRDITIHRGRSSDFDQFDTGTAQLVLDNRTRLFDPFYTSGTYYGKLLPRRQIRIRGTANSTTYDVFRGYIAGWPVTWSEAGYDSTVTIQAFDALGLMANETLPTDWAGYYTLSLGPRRYWKANDSQTTNIIRDQNTIVPAMNLAGGGSAPIFETPPLARGLINNALFSQTATVTGATIAVSPTNLTLTAWLNMTPTPAIVNTPFYYILPGMEILIDYVNATGDVRIQLTNSTNFRRYTINNIPANTPFFLGVVVTANAGGIPSAIIYVNGNTVSPASTTGAGSTAGSEYAEATLSNFQEVAIFTSQLTAAQIQTIYGYGAGRISESTTARMNRLIATTSYPAALQNFTASPVATVSEIGSGAGVIAEMQLVADSEGGEIYVAKDGKLTTTARFDVFNATRSANVQATITDSGAGLKYGPDLLIEYDADNLKNDISLQFSGDGEVNVSSDYTISTYGGASTTIETQLDSPTSATELANMELGVEGVLIPRISPLDLTPNTAAADWATILGLELLDRVTFKRTPTTGNQFSRDALVNAIDHQITPGVWQTQVTLSMRYTSPETLDDDVLGLLDLNYLG